MKENLFFKPAWQEEMEAKMFWHKVFMIALLLITVVIHIIFWTIIKEIEWDHIQQDDYAISLQRDMFKLREDYYGLDNRVLNNQNALRYFDDELKSQGYEGYYKYKVME